MTAQTRQCWQRSEITYCSNVHPGESLAELYHTIEHNIVAVRRRRELATMGTGLWISQKAAREIASTQDSIVEFAAYLKQHGLELTSLNGFPYGNFHSESVKENVYLPDWADSRRLSYTLDLANILSICLPEHQREGTISTLPLGFKPVWSNHRQGKALQALCQLVKALDKINQRTNRSIRVCLEMEPGCVLEHTDELIQFFQTALPAEARRHNIPVNTLQRHLGACFDVCHQAVMFEDPQASLARLGEAGISIGKIQISSALEYAHTREEMDYSALREFEEPRYLHQTSTRTENETYRVMDLNQAIKDEHFNSHTPWRIHFHLPVQLTSINGGSLTTTQSSIMQTLDYIQHNADFRPCLEVETYTWQVLPPELRPTTHEQLTDSIANETEWLEKELYKRKLMAANQ